MPSGLRSKPGPLGPDIWSYYYTGHKIVYMILNTESTEGNTIRFTPTQTSPFNGLTCPYLFLTIVGMGGGICLQGFTQGDGAVSLRGVGPKGRMPKGDPPAADHQSSQWFRHRRRVYSQKPMAILKRY